VRSTTSLYNQSNNGALLFAANQQAGDGLWGQSNSGNGVEGTSSTAAGVRAHSQSGTGLHAQSGIQSPSSTFPCAVLGEVSMPDGVSIDGNNYATSGLAQGVSGYTKNPTGIATTGWANANGTGLFGLSGPDFPKSSIPAKTGVFGYAEHGRGGAFAGPVAQIRLVPAGAASHPGNGAVGDLFLDGNHRLRFCKGGTTWKQIA
jgi:hypothetical protein